VRPRHRVDRLVQLVGRVVRQRCHSDAEKLPEAQLHSNQEAKSDRLLQAGLGCSMTSAFCVDLCVCICVCRPRLCMYVLMHVCI